MATQIEFDDIETLRVSELKFGALGWRLAIIMTDSMGNRIDLSLKTSHDAVLDKLKPETPVNAELLAASKLALPLMKAFFQTKDGKATIKLLEQAINQADSYHPAALGHQQ
ncbi:MAG: hypothetical protein EPN17_00860 [Methylobacter sp.]|nr:MAG: hypothetical protein EPN17_00860 [Methylobacter sp.]